MTQDHQPDIPVVLEQMVAGLSELETVLGDVGRDVVPVIRQKLIEAMAARDRGDSVAMLQSVGDAMKELAVAGDKLGAEDGRLMTMVAERFQGSLLRGDMADAKKDMQVMFDKSGARFREDD